MGEITIAHRWYSEKNNVIHFAIIILFHLIFIFNCYIWEINILNKYYLFDLFNTKKDKFYVVKNKIIRYKLLIT